MAIGIRLPHLFRCRRQRTISSLGIPSSGGESALFCFGDPLTSLDGWPQYLIRLPPPTAGERGKAGEVIDFDVTDGASPRGDRKAAAEKEEEEEEGQEKGESQFKMPKYRSREGKGNSFSSFGTEEGRKKGERGTSVRRQLVNEGGSGVDRLLLPSRPPAPSPFSF